MLNRRLHRLVWVYTYQNATLLEITCRGSIMSKDSLGYVVLMWIQTFWNCLKLWYWRRQRGAGTGAPDPPPPRKITSCLLFPRRKTGTNFSGEAPPPHPPPPLELSGSAHACLTVEFIFYFHFLHVAGLAILLSRANWLRGCAGWSAPLLFACNSPVSRNKVHTKANPDKMSLSSQRSFLFKCQKF